MCNQYHTAIFQNEGKNNITYTKVKTKGIYYE